MLPHLFTDRDGVDWRVSWRDAETIAMVVGGEDESFPAGFLFESSALVFRVPVYWVDPRLIPGARLQAMVDRGIGQ